MFSSYIQPDQLGEELREESRCVSSGVQLDIFKGETTEMGCATMDLKIVLPP